MWLQPVNLNWEVRRRTDNFVAFRAIKFNWNLIKKVLWVRKAIEIPETSDLRTLVKCNQKLKVQVAKWKVWWIFYALTNYQVQKAICEGGCCECDVKMSREHIDYVCSSPNWTSSNEASSNKRLDWEKFLNLNSASPKTFAINHAAHRNERRMSADANHLLDSAGSSYVCNWNGS